MKRVLAVVGMGIVVLAGIGAVSPAAGQEGPSRPGQPGGIPGGMGPMMGGVMGSSPAERPWITLALLR